MGNDEAGRKALARAGIEVRPAKRGSRSWRFETVRADYGEAMKLARTAAKALGGRIIQRANLHGKSLPFVTAASVRPGMAMVSVEGTIDTVESVRRVDGRARPVYDLDVRGTHNYIANGIVTHNSIYRFRGADVGNMNEFLRDFGVRDVVKLEQNYRSQGSILDAANAVIAQNKARLGKNLWTAEGKGEPLRIFAAATDEEEARFVVDEVKQLHREGTALADMALLYRSNAQSRILEHSLFRAGIAYKVYGGLRFFERQEVKHALAYLRLAANADDDTAFSRVVNFPPRGIGARTVEQLQEAAQAGLGSLSRAAKAGAVAGPRRGGHRGASSSIVERLRAGVGDAHAARAHRGDARGLRPQGPLRRRARRAGPRREPERAGERRDALRRGVRDRRRARGRGAGGRGARARARTSSRCSRRSSRTRAWRRASTRPPRARTRCS